MNEARFTINGTPSEDSNGNRWYIGSHSETLSIAMENPPEAALAVLYEVYDPTDENSPYASKNAPLISWNQGGGYTVTPAVPTGAVTIDLPATGVVSYLIRASVILAGGGNDVFERMVSIRTTITSPLLRKSVPAETAEYERRGISDHLNDIVDAINSLAGGGGGGGDGCTLDAAYDYGGPGIGRAITASDGAVQITVPNTYNNAALEIYQNNTTHDPNAVLISNAGDGYSLVLDGAGYQSIYATDALFINTSAGLRLHAGDEVEFADQHLFLSNWGWDFMPFSEGSSEWLVARALLGNTEGSLLALIAAAAAYGAGTLDDAYDYPTDGAGRSITVDTGSVAFTVPVTGTDSALTLSNLNSTNPSEVLNIHNAATLSTGYAIRLQGDAGGSNEDYNAIGHRIWTPGSLTVGGGDLSADYGESRAYFRSYWEDDVYVTTGGSAAAEIRVQGGASWAHYAYFKVSTAYNDGYEQARAYIISTASTHVQCNNFYIDDGNVAASAWPGSEILFSYNSTEVTALDALVDGSGNYHSLAGVILAAAASGGGGTQDLQDVYDQDPAVLIGSGGPISLSILGADSYHGISILKASGVGDSSLLRLANNDSGSCSIEFTGNYNNLYADRSLTIKAEDSTASPVFVEIIAEVHNVASYAGNASISLHAIGDTSENGTEGIISLHAEGGSDPLIILTSAGKIDVSTGGSFDFNANYVEAIGGCDYGPSYSNVVATNAFAFDPDNGVSQRVSITANSTWSLNSPGGCTRTTLWVHNGGGSAYTLTLTGGPSVTWFGGSTDGFSIPAGGAAIVTVIYDTNYDWAIGVSLAYT